MGRVINIPEVMLDENTGTLVVGKGIAFGTHISFDMAKRWTIGKESPEFVGTEGAQEQKITFRNVVVDDDYFILRLRFNNDKLLIIEIFISPVPFEFKENWADWSYEEEIKHLEHCKAWLQKEVGAKRNFDWGSIWCGYDSLGGFSSIKINYSRQ
ncbi:MAG: hypothetical protein CMH44_00595 [Muricauda sp.]|nr:hypothetical protein [uncultured Allomuricauda sp.]MAO15377.1 hypothetical protein [Allomuricauda sp.]MBC71340.1 hypothetical protein [Allomuricauda sp.]